MRYLLFLLFFSLVSCTISLKSQKQESFIFLEKLFVIEVKPITDSQYHVRLEDISFRCEVNSYGEGRVPSCSHSFYCSNFKEKTPKQILLGAQENNLKITQFNFESPPIDIKQRYCEITVEPCENDSRLRVRGFITMLSNLRIYDYPFYYNFDIKICPNKRHPFFRIANDFNKKDQISHRTQVYKELGLNDVTEKP